MCIRLIKRLLRRSADDLQRQREQQQLQDPEGNQRNAVHAVGHVHARDKFATKEIRWKFVRKVYGLLCIELVLFFGGASLGAFVEPIRVTFQSLGMWGLFGILIAFGIGAAIFFMILQMSSNIRRKFPVNYILLNLGVLCEVGAFIVITSLYDPMAFVIAVAATISLVLFLTGISFCPCLDVTGWGIYFVVAFFLLTIFGFIAFICAVFLRIGYIFVIYSAIGTIIVSMYIVYLTQLIIGGKKYELDDDEHVYAVIILFIAIVQLFHFLIRIIGGGGR